MVLLLLVALNWNCVIVLIGFIEVQELICLLWTFVIVLHFGILLLRSSDLLIVVVILESGDFT